jgi:sigma-B regulation protein RsbU (phosphoserine phosphatase)
MAGLSPKVLLLDGDPARTGAIAARLQPLGLDCSIQPLDAGSAPPNSDVAVLVVPSDASESQREKILKLLSDFDRQRVASVVWGAKTDDGCPMKRSLVECLGAEVSLDELLGRLQTLARYGPMVRQMDRELRQMETLSAQLTRYFTEIDQEMRLAGRLQRDFLPAAPPEVPPFRIETLYRPASFVSGDTYDLKKIDDRHVSLFMADAMGHGVAAGLITMFMQQALINKEMHDDVVRVVRPPEVLTRMHYCLCRQQLPNCQFVTGVYAVLDRKTNRIRLSRGGHPYPVHVSASGEIREVIAEGGLLGLADIEPEFDEITIDLAPGEKFILYSDGIEDLVIADASADGQERFTSQLRQWATLDAQQFMAAVADHLDRREGSLNPVDDVTLIVLEHCPPE